ncbi:MAG: serine/threonine-protein kinase [Chloroflexota bacterium]
MANSPLSLVDPLVGQRLSGFRIDSVIKRGGMAQVYKGWDVMLERPVAIKVVDSRFRNNPDYTERFLREARAVATWRHQHIMQIYSADMQDDLYYFAMEYIDGLDLGELMARYRADGELMPQDDILNIGRAIADALAYAHENGVIHRDVKPSNVMLSIDGRILLADFGLAMVVDQGTETEFLGTPHYIAPEQAIRAGDAVPQSDLYSMGVMLYEMLTGITPFNDPSLTGLAFQHIYESPASPRSLNPALGAEVEAVLLKALNKKPSDRYQTGEALLDALEAALKKGHPVAKGWVDLPPLPAGVSETSAADSLSQLSKQSVVEKIAFQLEQEEQQKREPTVRFPSLPTFGRVAAGVLLAAGLIFVGLWLWQRGNSASQAADEQGVVQSSEPTPVRAEGETAVLPSPVSAQITKTRPVASPTPVPTDVASSVVEETAVFTVTPIATQIATATPTPTLPPIPAFAGPPVQFIYDDRSFYVLNAGNAPIEAIHLSFIALDEVGESAGYNFLGRDWAKFYPEIDPGGCNRIEPIAYEEFLRPEQCEAFNSLVTPSLLDDTLFWLPRENVTRFAVFWDGQIIGRCLIELGSCSLRLPT